jgi:Fur family peroxide stress response transcriptional regulator
MDLHPTAEEVLHAVRRELPSLGLATVYRNLETLVREGRASRTMHPEGARYDGRVDPHHHFICTQCGRVANVEPCPEQASWAEAFQRKTGASVQRLVMELRGVCATCRQG